MQFQRSEEDHFNKSSAKCITEEGKELLPMHPLVATVSASFNSTTLLTDVGESYKITPDPKRSGDVIDLKVRIKENYNLSYEDIARFLEAFQAALDTTKLF